MHTHVHNSVIHSNQKVERHQKSIDRGMNKQNVIYPYNGILVLKGKGILTCYNVAEPRRHAEWKKPDAKGQILYDSIYMRFPE